MPIAEYAPTIAHSFCQRLTERDADVLYRVMRINVQIAIGLDVEINHPVTGYLIKHMLEEG